MRVMEDVSCCGCRNLLFVVGGDKEEAGEKEEFAVAACISGMLSYTFV